MQCKFVLTAYIEQAMAQAVYEKLEDGTFGATIPPCWGVIAFGDTLSECKDELQAVLEEWIVVGLRLGDEMPAVADISLNFEVAGEPVESL